MYVCGPDQADVFLIGQNSLKL